MPRATPILHHPASCGTSPINEKLVRRQKKKTTEKQVINEDEPLVNLTEEPATKRQKTGGKDIAAAVAGEVDQRATDLARGSLAAGHPKTPFVEAVANHVYPPNRPHPETPVRHADKTL